MERDGIRQRLAATLLSVHRHPAPGLAVGALLFGAAAFNVLLLPYPVWFVALNLILLPLMIFVGVKLARRPRTQPTMAG